MRKFFVYVSLITVICLLIPVFCNAGLRSKINQGNRHYKKNKFDKALQRYRDGLIDDPESKQLHFNLGDALYKNENYEEAIKEFQKATYSRDILLQSKSYYNIGNCLYRSGKLPESIQFYKKALELNPDDQDAKYNIEFVQKKIKEMLDKQSKDQQGQQQNQEQQQQQQAEVKEEKKGKEEQEQQKQDQEEKEGMSKEDAERLLQKFEEDEKEAQKQRKKISVPGRIRVEEDW